MRYIGEWKTYIISSLIIPSMQKSGMLLLLIRDILSDHKIQSESYLFNGKELTGNLTNIAIKIILIYVCLLCQFFIYHEVKIVFLTFHDTLNKLVFSKIGT
jgi:hypothetical protein